MVLPLHSAGSRMRCTSDGVTSSGLQTGGTIHSSPHTKQPHRSVSTSVAHDFAPALPLAWHVVGLLVAHSALLAPTSFISTPWPSHVNDLGWAPPLLQSCAATPQPLHSVSASRPSTASRVAK